jgi:hypothetical protein
MGASIAPRATGPSQRRRAFLAVSLIVVVVIVGTIGFRAIEGMGWVDAFYFESMLATGQGPPIQLTTDAGKIFASVMGFVSVGSVITSLVFTLVPIISQLWREGLERIETEAKTIERDVSAKKAETSA